MQTDNLKNNTPTDANNVLVAGLSPKKRVAWNIGKRTPITDEWGDKWCNCELPDLTTPVYRGDAWCRKCRCAWYH